MLRQSKFHKRTPIVAWFTSLSLQKVVWPLQALSEIFRWPFTPISKDNRLTTPKSKWHQFKSSASCLTKFHPRTVLTSEKLPVWLSIKNSPLWNWIQPRHLTSLRTRLFKKITCHSRRIKCLSLLPEKVQIWSEKTTWTNSLARLQKLIPLWEPEPTHLL